MFTGLMSWQQLLWKELGVTVAPDENHVNYDEEFRMDIYIFAIGLVMVLTGTN